MKTIKAVVQSGTGLHARPASQLVAEASKYESEIQIAKGETSVNAKSIFGILSLSAQTGDEVMISVEGSDEEAAITGIAKLFEEGL